MVKATLTADIPGIGKIDVDGNIATEESIRDLISAFSTQTRIQDKGISGLNQNASDAADGLDEFSDELHKAERSQKKLTDKMAGLADSAADGARGMQKFVDSGGDLSTFVSGFEGLARDIGRGIGGIVPIIGEGLEEFGGAVAGTAVALTAAAIGMVENFQGINKNLFNAGLQVRGGFDTFARIAEDSDIPISEFTNAIIQSSDRLRLFSGGAPGGIKQVSMALSKLHDDGIMDNLYSLGYTTEEVVASMVDYGIAAKRAGKNIDSATLADETNKYLRNLRELSRLTGVSVSDAQKQVEADRANLFVQNQLLDIAPEQRAAAQAFAAMLEQMGVGPMRDFIISGQSMSTESGIMSSQMGVTAGILQDAYQQIATGNMNFEEGQNYLQSQLRNRTGDITTELENLTRTFGVSPELASQFASLGIATRSASELINAASAQDTAGGTEIIPGTISDNLGKFESTLNNVQQEIQSVFIDGLAGVSPALSLVADMADDSSEALGDLKRSIRSLISGDLSSISGEMPSDPVTSLTTTISDAIFEGFSRVIRSMPGGSLLVGDSKEDRQSELDSMVQSFTDKQAKIDSGDMNWLSKGIAADQQKGKRAMIRTFLEENPDLARPEGFAGGGVSVGPASGYLEQLHGTEAIVPLPDGSSIPVSISSSGTETKNLTELVQVSKNMLGQMTASTQKLDQLLRLTDNANGIARSSAYGRA
jgi:hypothetical protein